MPQARNSIKIGIYNGPRDDKDNNFQTHTNNVLRGNVSTLNMCYYRFDVSRCGA